MKFYARDVNDDNKVKEIPEYIANAVLKQYIERRYTFAVAIGCFMIGFFAGIIAYAL